MFHVLLNPKAGREGEESVSQRLLQYYAKDDLIFHDVREIPDQGAFLEELPEGDKVIVCGGDGTLHHFANETYGKLEGRTVLYFATGSGNDFLTDIGYTKEGGPVKVNRFLASLPKVEVKGKTYRFLNNVSFGIDGYVCEEGDRIRANSDRPINYTLIAVKGFLGHFRPVNAEVTIDGVTRHYKKVWMAPSMNGRFFGGGMMAAPAQDRNNEEKTVSHLIFLGLGPLHTMLLFPTVFTGKHVKYTKNIHIVKGHDITVTFDRPCAVQIDGETILNVTSYHVMAQDR